MTSFGLTIWSFAHLLSVGSNSILRKILLILHFSYYNTIPTTILNPHNFTLSSNKISETRTLLENIPKKLFNSFVPYAQAYVSRLFCCMKRLSAFSAIVIQQSKLLEFLLSLIWQLWSSTNTKVTKQDHRTLQTNSNKIIKKKLNLKELKSPKLKL